MATNREKNYQLALERATETLRGLTPEAVAFKSATRHNRLADAGGTFAVPFWGERYIVTYPEGRVREAETGIEPPIATQILILHYLITATGQPMADRWVTFRELPGGLVYDAAFRGRSGMRLAAAYGSDLRGFIAAATALGGERLTYGDASFMFRLFPRMRLAAILHVADEEFPAGANILFDATAGDYLPTEDLAVLGGMLASRLLKAQRASRSA